MSDKINIEELKPNSHKYNTENEKKVTPVVDPSQVKTREKSIGRKFADVFLSDDVSSVKSYIFYDVVVPAIKDTIADVVKGAIDLLLYGNTRQPKKQDSYFGNVSYTSYSTISNKQPKAARLENRYDYRDIIFSSRSAAEEVLTQMVELISAYRQASVADLYDACNIIGNFTDNKYGWKDLSSASVKRVRDGYMLDLPRVQPLD